MAGGWVDAGCGFGNIGMGEALEPLWAMENLGRSHEQVLGSASAAAQRQQRAAAWRRVPPHTLIWSCPGSTTRELAQRAVDPSAANAPRRAALARYLSQYAAYFSESALLPRLFAGLTVGAGRGFNEEAMRDDLELLLAHLRTLDVASQVAAPVPPPESPGAGVPGPAGPVANAAASASEEAFASESYADPWAGGPPVGAEDSVFTYVWDLTGGEAPASPAGRGGAGPGLGLGGAPQSDSDLPLSSAANEEPVFRVAAARRLFSLVGLMRPRVGTQAVGSGPGPGET